MYRPIGYEKARLFPILSTAVRNLIANDLIDDKWAEILEKGINSTDLENIANNVKLQLNGIVPEIGNFYFVTSAQLAALKPPFSTFFGWFFNASRRVSDPENIPVVLSKYTKHCLTLTEILEDFAMTKIDMLRLPGLETSLSGSSSGRSLPRTPLKRDVVVSTAVQAAQALVQSLSQLDDYRALVSRHVNNIAYQVKKGRYNPPQFDKTLLANALDPAFNLGSVISPGSQKDFDFSQTILFEELKSFITSRYLPGPYSKVVGMLSTGGLYNTALYIGHYTPTLKIAQGRTVPFFNMHSLHFDTTLEFKWDAETLRKHQVATASNSMKHATDEISVSGNIFGDIGPLDEEDIEYTIVNDSIKSRYYSPFFSKTIFLDQDPTLYYFDHFSREQISKPSAYGASGIDYPIVDIKSIESSIVSVPRSLDIKLARLDKSGVWKWKSSAVNLKAAYPGGNRFLRPVSAESFTVDVNDLLTVDMDLVGLIEGQLGLSTEEASLNRYNISYQVNAWKFREVVGSQQALLTSERVDGFLRELSPTVTGFAEAKSEPSVSI
jgi:hypothetical protein